MKRLAIPATAKALCPITTNMTMCIAHIGKQLAYLALETPQAALKPSAEQGDIGELRQPSHPRPGTCTMNAFVQVMWPMTLA